MDGQLYVWARNQELRRELARRALVSEAKAFRAQGNPGRRDTMAGIEAHRKATTLTEEEDMQRKPVVSETPVQAQQNGRAWRWRVEPGMEEAFQDLLGWMLPAQQGAEVETAGSPPQPSASVAAEQRPAPQPTASGERRPASELKPLAA